MLSRKALGYVIYNLFWSCSLELGEVFGTGVYISLNKSLSPLMLI